MEDAPISRRKTISTTGFIRRTALVVTGGFTASFPAIQAKWAAVQRPLTHSADIGAIRRRQGRYRPDDQDARLPGRAPSRTLAFRDAHLPGRAPSRTRAFEEADHNIQRRQADPREVAWPILWLASDEASFVTASVNMADGGACVLQVRN